MQHSPGTQVQHIPGTQVLLDFKFFAYLCLLDLILNFVVFIFFLKVSETSDSSLLPSSCVVIFSVRFNVYIPAGFS